ncbi:MAG: hypothetical protein ACRDKB_05995 [Actinomycetota bacterium]
MAEMFCPSCRLRQPSDHVFCVRCGAELPAHLLGDAAKQSRWFAGVPVAPDDPRGAYLKVSRYLRDQTFRSAEGEVTIPGNHVRFSVWVGDEARCVISLSETEARDLATFLASEAARSNDFSTEIR